MDYSPGLSWSVWLGILGLALHHVSLASPCQWWWASLPHSSSSPPLSRRTWTMCSTAPLWSPSALREEWPGGLADLAQNQTCLLPHSYKCAPFPALKCQACTIYHLYDHLPKGECSRVVSYASRNYENSIIHMTYRKKKILLRNEKKKLRIQQSGRCCTSGGGCKPAMGDAIVKGPQILKGLILRDGWVATLTVLTFLPQLTLNSDSSACVSCCSSWVRALPPPQPWCDPAAHPASQSLCSWP